MNKAPLSQLLDLAQQREDVERAILNAVAKSRSNGDSWQAIAHVIGGTKQAAQQRYGKAIEPLMETSRYECSCGWGIAYPGFEASEAADDIAEHRDMHDREDEADDYGTEPADLDQLPADTTAAKRTTTKAREETCTSGFTPDATPPTATAPSTPNTKDCKTMHYYAYDLHNNEPHNNYAYENEPVARAAVNALNTNNGDLRYVLKEIED